MLPSFWMCNLSVIFKCPTGFLLSSPAWSLNLRAVAAFQQMLPFFPSSKGASITFSGLWHNLDQSQGLYRVIILTADTPYHTLLPFSTSGSWYKVKSLELLHCVAGALENVTLLKNPHMIVLCLRTGQSALVNFFAKVINQQTRPRISKLECELWQYSIDNELDNQVTI